MIRLESIRTSINMDEYLRTRFTQSVSSSRSSHNVSVLVLVLVVLLHTGGGAVVSEL